MNTPKKTLSLYLRNLLLIISLFISLHTMAGEIPDDVAKNRKDTFESLLFSDPPPLSATLRSILENHFGVDKSPNNHKDVYYVLNIGYVNGKIYDPSSNRFQKVRLRGYTGEDSNHKRITEVNQFVAPQIEAHPGDTVRILLKNNLPADATCLNSHVMQQQTTANKLADKPHCFNGTNLHAHGLWISPTGNSDNVLLSINPGINFEYQYDLSNDIPEGTFWYHSHRHGSTALQVSSGMAGALIIRGNRKPTPTSNGDLSTLLIDPDTGKSYKEHTVLFQQIAYACQGKDGKLKRTQDGKINWSCNPGETGVIESYDQFGPGTWPASGRWTSINGIVLPTFKSQVGDVERWRLIHAGVRETINLTFRKINPKINLNELHKRAYTGNLKKQDAARLVEELCSGETIPFQIVAADGLTMSHTITSEKVTLQPGYRYDLLTIFPSAGGYCMIQPQQPKAGSINSESSAQSLLGFVSVAGKENIPTNAITSTLVNKLTKSAEKFMPENVRAEIVKDIAHVEGKDNHHGILLTKFTPHPGDITEDDVRGQAKQKLVFFVGADQKNNPIFALSHDFSVEKTNGIYMPSKLFIYDPNKVGLTLPLGKAQEWELRSYSVSHPFHIHVNPFQIVAIYDPQGRDVSEPGVVEADGDTQFSGLKGQWKDTILVKTNLLPGDLKKDPKNFYRFVIRTRYKRYIGEFVLHCHILDHEDQGMMENIAVSLPDSVGPSSNLMTEQHHSKMP
ncbi:multicopper oxidase family protein [Xylella taiwanensis]|nr:L-ascorbate oxidase [Xylella taiwanensis]EWS78093.1 L-ascorbate oxidase [Xylella taiwanensis]NBI36286.1 multicopper oxidase family protein [Xylella taiwanensis]QKD99635.1 multicopper oxidase family protein [Xylella taiwanensis]